MQARPILKAPPRPLRRVAAILLVALLGPCLVGIAARTLGADLIFWLVATILASIAGIALAFSVVRGTLCGVVAVVVIAVVPLGIAGPLTEARSIGLLQALPVAQIGQRPLAAAFILTDGAVPRTDLREVVTVVDTWSGRRSGPGRRQDTYVIAPVLPPGWSPDQPVTAVALVASRSEYAVRVPAHPAWSAAGGLLRLLDDDLQTRAVDRALRQGGLQASGDLVIGAWVPDPGMARLDASLPGLAVVGAAFLVLLGLVVHDRRA